MSRLFFSSSRRPAALYRTEGILELPAWTGWPVREEGVTVLAKVASSTLLGVDACIIEVEVDFGQWSPHVHHGWTPR